MLSSKLSDLNYLCAPTNAFCLHHAISEKEEVAMDCKVCHALSNTRSCRNDSNRAFEGAVVEIHICKCNTIVTTRWSVCSYVLL